MCYGREKRIRYLGDKGGLKTQVHHEPQEGIHDVPEQVRILLTLGLGKQNKVITDLPAACHGHLFPLAMVPDLSHSLNGQCHELK